MAALATAGARGAPLPVLEWATAARAYEGEQRSGDVHIVHAIPDGVLLAVIDGLGHGDDAADAASAAAAVITPHADEAPAAILRRCHDALRGTRGAVMTVASLSARDERIAWIGVGNVEGILLRGRLGDVGAPVLAPLRSGILGHRLPALHPSVQPVSQGDVLVLASDGIKPGFSGPVSERESTQVIADRILAEHGNPADDALVLVARYRGHGR